MPILGTIASSFDNTPAARGLIAGGYNLGENAQSNVIDYITFTTAGNATDFGDLTSGRHAHGGNASSTRALFGTGQTSSVVSSVDYVTVATTGNGTNFGNLTQGRREVGGGVGSETRAIWGNGQGGSYDVYNTIDYVTIATTGNGTDFGDSTVARMSMQGFGSSTRGIWAAGAVAGGNPTSNVID